MSRGEIWTAASKGSYVGKPRPVVILQDPRFDSIDSVTVCPFTTDVAEAPFVRLVVTPDAVNGLADCSSVMLDKITTMPRTKLGTRVGRLSDQDMVRVNRALVVFLGLAG